MPSEVVVSNGVESMFVVVSEDDDDEDGDCVDMVVVDCGIERVRVC